MGKNKQKNNTQKIKNKIKEFVILIDFEKRRKRKLAAYKKEIEYFRKMNDDEISYEYVCAKTEYHHRKNILWVLVTATLVSMLTGLWRRFLEFIKNAAEFYYKNSSSVEVTNDIDIIRIVTICFIMAVLTITVFLFYILIDHIKSLNKIYKKLITIEEIRDKK
jgi:hypothetical protein